MVQAAQNVMELRSPSLAAATAAMIPRKRSAPQRLLFDARQGHRHRRAGAEASAK